MGGPCRGHLLVLHVPLMVESPVGQLNSLPVLSQTGAKFPGQENVLSLFVLEGIAKYFFSFHRSLWS